MLQHIFAGLLAATSVVCSPTPAQKRTQAKVHAPAVYPQLVQYAAFCGAAYDDTCPIPPKNTSVVQYLNNIWTDTQGTLFRDDSAKSFILAMRGSSDDQDYITDVSFVAVPYIPGPGVACLGCAVHDGFYTSWSSVLATIESALDAGLASHPGYSVVLTGHSLGAALTNLAFASLMPMAKYNVTAAYTFGEPRVGNPAYASYIDKLSGATDQNAGIYYRVTHTNDGVPLLPPQLLGFRHPRTEYWLDNTTTNGFPTAATTYRCFGDEPTDCNNAQGGFLINTAHKTYPGLNYSCTTGV